MAMVEAKIKAEERVWNEERRARSLPVITVTREPESEPIEEFTRPIRFED
jgi:hypothetical protein